MDRDATERQRRLDLYKTVYPEKFKAAKEVVEKASVLQHRYLLYLATGCKSADRSALLREALTFRMLTQSHEWLVGEMAVRAARNYETALVDAVQAKKEGHDGVVIEETVTSAFFSLATAVRAILHVEEFDTLFPIASQSGQIVKSAPERP